MIPVLMTHAVYWQWGGYMGMVNRGYVRNERQEPLDMTR